MLVWGLCFVEVPAARGCFPLCRLRCICGFAEFMRRTIDDHPIELCGVKLAMGANSLWEVIHHVGSSILPLPGPLSPLCWPPHGHLIYLIDQSRNAKFLVFS